MAIHLVKIFWVQKITFFTRNFEINFVKLNVKQLLVVAIGLLVNITCHSAAITFHKATENNDNKILISGEILKGDEEKFKEVALHSNKAIVYIDGPGGDLGAAIKIGRLVNALGYFTAVNEAQCASACAMIWLAGHFKFLSPNAQVGFHLPKFDEEGKNFTKNIGVLYALVGAYLANLGFAEPYIAYMMDTENGQMKWLTTKNAKFFGVTTFSLVP